MERRLPTLFLCLLLSLGATPPAEGASLGLGGYVPGQMICVLEPGISIDQMNAWYGTATIDRVGRAYLLRVPEGRDAVKVARHMRSLYGVAATGVNTYLSSPNARRRLGQRNSPLSFPFDRASDVTYDPTSYDTQPFLERLQVEHAAQMAGGEGVVVAVIDTGVDVTHPALAGHLLTDGDAVVGYDFVDDDADPSEGGNAPDPYSDDPNDPNAAYGHGTFIAGLVAKVAPRARIMPVRAFGPDGVGTLFGAIQAVAFARDHGADVVNMSFGAPERLAGLEQLIAKMGPDVMFVAAVGNDNTGEPMYPASHASVLAVTAVDDRDVKAAFSNYGKKVDIAAPGVTLVSAYPGNRYAVWSGTSFAAPIVSATAALVLSHRANEANSDKVRSRGVGRVLEKTAAPLGGENVEFLGSGRIDPLAALTRVAE